MNEIGEVGIDASMLIAQGSVDDRSVALVNGCVCCSVNESLQETASALVKGAPPLSPNL